MMLLIVLVLWVLKYIFDIVRICFKVKFFIEVYYCNNYIIIVRLKFNYVLLEVEIFLDE